ncbi:TNF receptor-associated factor 4, partial [Geodia barretti]
AHGARARAARVKSRIRGGYDCEFVTPPPDVFQIECPICLQIPKEPCLISCPCGKEFCRECIERIKEDGKPCPLCNLSDFTFLRHHGSERYLKAQEVWCSHKKDGCKWTGKLGEYERHLNRNPSPENQLTGCQFVPIECEHGCGEWFQRHHIASHQKGACPKRPYSCEHCHEYESTFEDVTKNHYPQCVKYPVTCPNKCRDAPFERQNVNNHVKDECPLTEVDCPLHYAGCEVRLPRKDMPEHMTDTVTHLTLLATVTQSLLKENQELRQTTEDLKKENQELRQTTEVLKKEN